MKAGQDEIRSSEKDPKKKERVEFVKTLLLIIFLLMPVRSCGSSTSPANNFLDGRAMTLRGEETDQLYKNENVIRLKDKYLRHYQNGLHFEDFSQAERELNEHFYRYFQGQIQKALNAEAKALQKAPYLLRTKVEFIRSEVKKYAQGKRSAEEILRDPDSIMGIRMEYYAFVTAKERRQEPIYLAYAQIERKLLGKRLYHDYVKQGVEPVEYWATLYDAAELEKIPLKQLEKEPYPFVALGSDCVTFDSSAYLKTPYENSMFDEDMFEWEETFKDTIYDGGFSIYTTRRLEEKYKIPFVLRGGDWYSAAAYPELFFKVDRAEVAGNKILREDYFLSVLTQHLFNKKIQALLKELGLENEVVFLIRVNSHLDIYNEYNPYAAAYDCSTLDEAAFLKRGTAASVYITFLYLHEVSKEELAQMQEGLREMSEKEWFYYEMEEGEAKPLRRIEDLAKAIIEMTEKDALKEGEEKGMPHGVKWINVYEVRMTPYEKRVALDLFRRQEITERTREPKLSLYEGFSDRYRTRNDTEAFRYLDIFGNLLIQRGEIGRQGYREMQHRGF